MDGDLFPDELLGIVHRGGVPVKTRETGARKPRGIFDTEQWSFLDPVPANDAPGAAGRILEVPAGVWFDSAGAFRVRTALPGGRAGVEERLFDPGSAARNVGIHRQIFGDGSRAHSRRRECNAFDRGPTAEQPVDSGWRLYLGGAG